MFVLITIKKSRTEEYDSETNEFIYHDGSEVSFEYSLKAVFDWESRWKKPFLRNDLTNEESIDFYKTMALGPMDDDFLTVDVIQQLSDYINDPNTATTFTSNFGEGNTGGSGKGKINTSEEIYASMFSAGVPLEFENRNLNRLLAILKIISLANEPPKKMSREEVVRQNASLNAQRKAMLNSKG